MTLEVNSKEAQGKLSSLIEVVKSGTERVQIMEDGKVVAELSAPVRGRCAHNPHQEEVDEEYSYRTEGETLAGR